MNPLTRHRPNMWRLTIGLTNTIEGIPDSVDLIDFQTRASLFHADGYYQFLGTRLNMTCSMGHTEPDFKCGCGIKLSLNPNVALALIEEEGFNIFFFEPWGKVIVDDNLNVFAEHAIVVKNIHYLEAYDTDPSDNILYRELAYHGNGIAQKYSEQGQKEHDILEKVWEQAWTTILNS